MDRILVVDDDPVIIKLYQIILIKEGFEVTTATNGEQLMLAIKAPKPDIILLDVILPDATGLDLCSRIKNNPAHWDIKIILVSGMEVSPSQVAEGIGIGADDYLVKPVDSKELLARIKNCLKLKKAEAELKDKNKELKDLANHLQNIREEERKLIAREVQEELGQLTAVLKMDIDWLSINMSEASETHKKRITHASDTARLIINTIRRIASALRPSMLDELGLNASLEWLSKDFSSANNIPCSFTGAEDDEDLSTPIKTALFRICQESLKNISQHANASEVSIITTVSDNKIALSIYDNGKGFDRTQPVNTLGLIGMRERALAVNGELHIDSSPAQGTKVSVIVPKI